MWRNNLLKSSFQKTTWTNKTKLTSVKWYSGRIYSSLFKSWSIWIVWGHIRRLNFYLGRFLKNLLKNNNATCIINIIAYMQAPDILSILNCSNCDLWTFLWPRNCFKIWYRNVYENVSYCSCIALQLRTAMQWYMI